MTEKDTASAGLNPAGSEEYEDFDEDRELGGHMSFLEHLSELRDRLIRILIGLGVAVVICFMFSDQLIYLLLNPIPREVLEEKIAKQLDQRAPVDAQLPGTAEITGENVQEDAVKIITTTPVQGIIVMMKVSFVAGIFIAFPWIFYQIWMFVSPGLYRREKKIVFPIILSSWGCFVGGGLFCYFVVFRYALLFLIQITPGVLEQHWIISDYMDFMLRVILAFGIVFQEPVIIFMLAKFGIVNSDQLRHFRPYAIVGLFVLAAIITPPDPITQMSCAVPLLLLYELSILVVKRIETKREEAVA